ncbi:YecA family protein [Geomonas sp. Red32]|uniref:UPF0149 family protein n=1 Tax=Geomonas sp. Red32 TaxID=2912856 RepID=UPI00202CD650|nr:UPF0149 family protein [Geomonas sp. Red32]MCM0084431.1 YecA family protein [Geomonas sp. Red32]
MSENLLEAPERDAIEAHLKKCQENFGRETSFEQLLGFVTGAVITPGGFEPSDWLQQLFDLNGIALGAVEEIEVFMESLLSLYERVEAVKLQGGKLFPFDLLKVNLVSDAQPVIDWATGLHHAISSQEDIWIPYEDEVDDIDEKLKEEVNLNIQSLGTVVDPSTIPEIVKDPIPFQRNVLAGSPDWHHALRESWDEELIMLFRIFGIARLHHIVDSLQRYAAAYDEDFVVVDASKLGMPRDGEES